MRRHCYVLVLTLFTSALVACATTGDSGVGGDTGAGGKADDPSGCTARSADGQAGQGSASTDGNDTPDTATALPWTNTTPIEASDPFRNYNSTLSDPSDVDWFSLTYQFRASCNTCFVPFATLSPGAFEVCAFVPKSEVALRGAISCEPGQQTEDGDLVGCCATPEAGSDKGAQVQIWNSWVHNPGESATALYRIRSVGDTGVCAPYTLEYGHFSG